MRLIAAAATAVVPQLAQVLGNDLKLKYACLSVQAVDIVWKYVCELADFRDSTP